MRHMFRLVMSLAWLLLFAAAVVQPAGAQKRYPSPDEAWDATDYRAMVERIEKDGLELPTLATEETKVVFERMVAGDNIPLRMGQNPELAITVRYQKLEPILQPLHELVVLYTNGAQEGKPYATELASLMVYETRAAGALLDIGEPYLASLKLDPRYKTHVALIDDMKNGARQLYSDLVTSMGQTKLYSKGDILKMSKGALNNIRSYDPIFTDKDRSSLSQNLAKQISATSDQELKTALTDLHDAIKHGRIPT